jgi:hypothetical protein
LSVPAKKTSPFEIRRKRIGHLLRHVLKIATWLQPTDFAVARSYCETQVVAAGLFAKIVALGVEKNDGEVRAIVDAWRRVKQTELQYANALGLSPKARKELRDAGGRDVPEDVIELSPEREAEAIEAGAVTGHHVEETDEG